MSFFDKPLESLTREDVETFIAEKWSERTTVDYKRDPDGNSHKDKKELLKDVSSFANTSGGTILIGVDELDSEPTAIVGTERMSMTKCGRMDGIIRGGLEPPIGFGIFPVKISDGRHVLVIRIEDSLIGPHRVVFHGQTGEFWARTNKGRYSMNTDQLRQAFNLTQTIRDRMGRFSYRSGSKNPFQRRSSS